MLRIRVLLLVAGCLALKPFPAGDGHLRAQQVTAPSPVASHAPYEAVIGSYCAGCHNQRLRTGGLAFDALDMSDVGTRADVWEKVFQKLRMGAMPPPGLPRPDKPTLDAFIAWLETELDLPAGREPNPGRTGSVHRLNRFEYRNAVRDLLGLDIDVDALLPVDDADKNGFDNVATMLSVSPTLLDRYLSAARKLSRLALGIPPVGPATDTYKAPLLLDQNGADERAVAVRIARRLRGAALLSGRWRVHRSRFASGGNSTTTSSVSARRTGSRCAWMASAFSLDRRRCGDGEPRLRRASWGRCSATRRGRSTLSRRTRAWRFGSGHGPVHGSSASRSSRGCPCPRMACSRPGDQAGVRKNVTRCSKAIHRRQRGDRRAVLGRWSRAIRRAAVRSLSCRPAAAAENRRAPGRFFRRSRAEPIAGPSPIRKSGPAAFLRGRPERGQLRHGPAVRARERLLADPNFLFRIERDPANVAARHGVPPHGSRACVPAVVLPVEQRARRASCSTWLSRGRLKEPAVLDQQVAAHAGFSAVDGGARGQFRRPVAAAASAAQRRAERRGVSGLRRELARGVSPGDEPVRRQHAAAKTAAWWTC